MNVDVAALVVGLLGGSAAAALMHTVQLETKQSAFVSTTNSENFHVTAVALGNG